MPARHDEVRRRHFRAAGDRTSIGRMNEHAPSHDSPIEHSPDRQIQHSPIQQSPIQQRPIADRPRDALVSDTLVRDTPDRLYPLFADLHGKPVLVVGGGPVGARKIESLLQSGAVVRLVAVTVVDGLAERVADGRVQHVATAFEPAQLDDVWLAIAATDDRALNAAVQREAVARRVFVNVVDDASLCEFHVPAVIDRAPVTVAISSRGLAPVLSRRLRARIEQMLDPALGPLAALLGRWRERIRQHLPDVSSRRRFLETLDESPVTDLLRQGRPQAAEQAFAARLREAEPTPRGLVSLVGAGAGDAGLMTLAGQRRLQQADVVLYDQLVSADVLALARRDAELVPTGKRAGGHRIEQARIHALMLSHAAVGHRVVRLKGGDPFVFGRGGEELEFLRAHGIDYEVVPGITAALACAAGSGIPLTHRDHAQSVRLLTAHCRESLDSLDWPALAQERQTLAVYMGVGLLGTLQQQLLAHGRAASTPFALVENGGRSDQRVVAGTLDRLTELATRHAVRSPALLIVGEVAGLAKTLHWFGEAPLGEDDVQAAIDGASSLSPRPRVEPRRAA